MCGIIGLHLRDPELQPMLGRLLDDMLCGVSERGPDSVGIAVYGDGERNPEGHSAVSVLRAPGDLAASAGALLPGTPTVTARVAGDTTVLSAPVGVEALTAAVAAAAPEALVVGSGNDLVVYKGAGHPQDLARTYGLRARQRLAGRSPTPAWPPSRRSTPRAATRSRSAPTSAWCTTARSPTTPRSAASCERQGVTFDSENDSEVGARFVAACLAEGDDLEKALLRLGETFDGFYTLLVTTADGFAVVRDEIACKPADDRRAPPLGGHGVGVPRPRGAPRDRRGPRLRARSRARSTHGSAEPGRGGRPSPVVFDLHETTVRALNAELHAPTATSYEVLHPQGAHAARRRHPRRDRRRGARARRLLLRGDEPARRVVVDGSAGNGVAENMMSGSVRVRGDASQSAGATGHGGLLVIEGSASMRCGISMKGIDIVVGGYVGPMSAFMAQAGRLVVCGDAGDGLGDSIYEARLYVRGSVGLLGADCVEKPLRDEHVAELTELLDAAGLDHDPEEFRRFGSARGLYHFTGDHGSY